MGSEEWAAEAGSDCCETVTACGTAATRDDPSHGKSNALSLGNGNNSAGLAGGHCKRTWAGCSKGAGSRMGGLVGTPVRTNGTVGNDGTGMGMMAVTGETEAGMGKGSCRAGDIAGRRDGSWAWGSGIKAEAAGIGRSSSGRMDTACKIGGAAGHDNSGMGVIAAASGACDWQASSDDSTHGLITTHTTVCVGIAPSRGRRSDLLSSFGGSHSNGTWMGGSGCLMGVGDGSNDAMGISCTEAGATAATGGAWRNDSASVRWA